MKLYPNLVKAIAEAIEQIFIEGVYADVAVERTLKKDARWGARDRRFIASYIYDIVRWYRLYKACLTEEQQATNLYYSLFAVAHLVKGFELPTWAEFANTDSDYVRNALLSNSKIHKLKASIPDWLDELGEEQFGAKVWATEMEFLNKEAEVFIRVNNLKSSAIKLPTELTKEGIEIIKVEGAIFKSNDNEAPLKIVKRQRLQQLQSYKDGLFEIQDAASQLVAPYLQLKPGMKVIDACAGAGGKTLHIACIMQNKGSILAMDIEAKKLEELERRALKAGVRIVTTKVATKQEVLKNKETADRLLLDVPCSGLGVLRRNPDAKWKLNLEFIKEVQQTQANILSDYSTMLKPGGIMVYATCSILPIENQFQVQYFLNQQQGKFELIAEQSIMPSQGFDGFYMASLKKT